jgi:enoyl-CoA hydratase/carnithine racemase
MAIKATGGWRTPEAPDRMEPRYDRFVASFLTITDTDDVRTITMSNPGRMNAAPPEGWVELADAFEAFEASDARVLVLTGADGEFCAGADMTRERADVPSAADNVRRMASTVNRAAVALHRMSKPTIAAVDGVAVGAGMNLAIGCDIVIATSRARFAEVFVKRGLTLDFGGTWLLPRLVGLARAREIALTGRIVDAAEARAIGLVSEVVDQEALGPRVEAVAGELADGAPLAQALIKRALDRSSSMTFEQALAFEAHAQGILLGSEDLAEGAAAFVERRPPRFRGH